MRRVGRRLAVAVLPFLLAMATVSRPSWATQPAVGGADEPLRLDSGRFTVVTYPRDLPLARSLLTAALARDSFPGLPRPRRAVIIAIAPDVARFREWIGPTVPEWGAAVAMPARSRIVVRGRGAGAAAGGEPRTVLRHELAHLALHEAMDDLPPRWFDEGYASYAAGEWGRDELLATNLALLFRPLPTLDALDRQLTAGAQEARSAYALSHRAVAELASLDSERGLSMMFAYWKDGGRLDRAVRRAYGITLDGFEERWQRRTRLRYGVLALVGDLTVATVFALAVMIPLSVARRRRDRQRMERLRRVDRILDARAAAAGTTVEVLLGLADPPPPPEAQDGEGPAVNTAMDGDGSPLPGAEAGTGGDVDLAGPFEADQPASGTTRA
ncbi:MAG: peptidase MA family metallohydrolase [Gemmatimonadaceae bacterium]